MYLAYFKRCRLKNWWLDWIWKHAKSKYDCTFIIASMRHFFKMNGSVKTLKARCFLFLWIFYFASRRRMEQSITKLFEISSYLLPARIPWASLKRKGNGIYFTVGAILLSWSDRLNDFDTFTDGVYDEILDLPVVVYWILKAMEGTHFLWLSNSVPHGLWV
jgi:hypothetical protein